MKNEILENTKKIATRGSEQDYEEALQVLSNHLKDNPKDTDAWLLMARIECNSPLEYPDKIIEYTHNVLSYDPSNAFALLFLAYTKYYLLGGIDNNTYIKLCSANSNNPEIMAMIEIAKARYFNDKKDFDNYEKSLKKSIEYSDKLASNFIELAILYTKKKQPAIGLFQKGLNNVNKIFPPNPGEKYDYDPTSIPDFFGEFYARTTMARDEYEYYQSLLSILQM